MPPAYAGSIAAAMLDGHARAKLKVASLSASLAQQPGVDSDAFATLKRRAFDAIDFGRLMQSLLSAPVLQGTDFYASDVWCAFRYFVYADSQCLLACLLAFVMSFTAWLVWGQQPADEPQPRKRRRVIHTHAIALTVRMLRSSLRVPDWVPAGLVAAAEACLRKRRTSDPQVDLADVVSALEDVACELQSGRYLDIAGCTQVWHMLPSSSCTASLQSITFGQGFASFTHGSV